MILSKILHPVFEKFQTDVLEKIAWRIDSIDKEESKNKELKKLLDEW